MAVGIVLWSKKPVHHKKMLMKMVEASYESDIPFYCHGVLSYMNKGKKKFYPNQFTLMHKDEKSIFMIFHICPIEEQKNGLCKCIDAKFTLLDESKIAFPELYQLAASENMDNEMTFYFSYHYLKKNKDHIISFYDYLIDWELINHAHKNGFEEDWYGRLKNEM
ncbi:MAG: hypothetical protein ACOYOA_11445 [Saprospiraceae bacterium]